MKVRSFFRVYLGLLSAVIVTVFLIIVISPVTTPTLQSIIVSTVAVLSVVGLYAILVDYSVSYLLAMLSLLLFPFFSIMVWSSQRIPDQWFVIVNLSIQILFTVIASISHLKTKKRNFTTSSVYKTSMFTLLIFTWSAVLLSSITQHAPQVSVDFFFFYGLGIFVFVSVQITNMTYRVKELNEKWDVSNRIKQLELYNERLQKKIEEYDEEEKKQIKTIQFFLEHSVTDFISGDFETSFLNSFKILFDQYPDGNYVFKNIYQIEKYSTLRGKFASIRNDLVHSRDPDELKKTKKNLFQNSLELLRIIKWDYMDKLISKSPILGKEKMRKNQ